MGTTIEIAGAFSLGWYFENVVVGWTLADPLRRGHANRPAVASREGMWTDAIG
jgi:hypothetical protein